MSIPRAAPEPGRARVAFPFLPRRPGPARAAAGTCAWLAMACAGAALAPDGIALLPARTLAAPEELIASVRANGVARGEFTLARAGGDFWLRAADLPRLQVPPRDEARRDIAGEAWYSARGLGATALSFDESALTLQVDFRPEALPGTRIDLATRPSALQRAPATDSVVLGYRASAFQSSQGQPQARMAAELNVRAAGLLLRQEARLDTSRGGGLHRGFTQAIHDDYAHARRVAAGDVFSTAGPYGSSITGAGLLFAKVYDLMPEFVRQPTARIQASTLLPAQVEVSVDGTPVFRGNAGPGPITLDNLLVNGGTRNVQVVITDAAGRREVIERPFLFTDTVLAQGLHDFSYFAGKRSELGADDRLHYREAAWQAFHRYGLNDHVTVSAGGEGSADFRNGGAGITLRSDRAGLLALDLLASRDRATAHTAHGWSARYSWLSPLGTLVLGRREFGPGFRSFAGDAAALFPRSETRIGVTTVLGRASVSADVVRTVTEHDVRHSGFLRAGTAIARNVWLLGELQSTRIDERRGWAASVYLRADLDREHWVSTAARTEPGSRRLDVEAGRQLPDGEGYGWRVGASSLWTQGGREAGLEAFGSVDWNLRPATVSLSAASNFTGHGTSFVQADIAGALVGMAGYWGFTRQVADSFVLARLGVPQQGVRIYLNNQLQGRTDAQGRLLIPQVSSLGRQEVAVDDQDLDLRYVLRERQRPVTPPYRSGTVVDFGITRLRALAGTAWLVDGGRRTPVAGRAWTMSGMGRSLAIGTGSGGEFYLEDAPAGSYTGTLQAGSRRYACRLRVPEFEDAVHELKEGIVCE